MTTKDRAIGCLLGLAIGDALGAPLEFSARDSLPPVTGFRAGGPFNLGAGEWTDDTSCALALADALLDDGGCLIAETLLWNLNSWYTEGKYSVNGRCFDIGNATITGIMAFICDESTVNGSPRTQGNGALMRMAPVAIAAESRASAEVLAARQTSTTHNSPMCQTYSRKLAAQLWDEIAGNPWPCPRRISSTPRDEISSSGHVRDTYLAAQWAVGNTGNFRDAVLLAANLGDDSDTVAAVTGQIAGARYGLGGIPPAWVAELAWRPMLLDVGAQLYALRERV